MAYPWKNLSIESSDSRQCGTNCRTSMSQTLKIPGRNHQRSEILEGNNERIKQSFESKSNQETVILREVYRLNRQLNESAQLSNYVKES